MRVGADVGLLSATVSTVVDSLLSSRQPTVYDSRLGRAGAYLGRRYTGPVWTGD